MKLLIQLAFLWVVWLVSPRRWRRLLGMLFAALATGLIGVSPWGVQLGLLGLTLWLPPDTGDTTDAIVVLGRGEAFRDLRTGVAQELWQTQRAPKIFASGMMDAKLIVQKLEELGTPAWQVSGEECSRSTQENALFTAALLRPHGVQDILLVTDYPHMLRSLLIFRENGFRVIPHAVPLPPQHTPLDRQRCLLREYLALVKGVLIRVQLIPDPSPITPAEVATRIRDWHCWIRGESYESLKSDQP